jgi:hypothetical protein
VTLVRLSVANSRVGIELGYFMCIHTRGRHSDPTRPVEVAVTEGKDEFFSSALPQIRVVHGNIDVSWSDTALSRGIRKDKEVKWFPKATTTFRSILHNEVSVNYAASRRI